MLRKALIDVSCFNAGQCVLFLNIIKYFNNGFSESDEMIKNNVRATSRISHLTGTNYDKIVFGMKNNFTLFFLDNIAISFSHFVIEMLEFGGFINVTNI